MIPAWNLDESFSNGLKSPNNLFRNPEIAPKGIPEFHQFSCNHYLHYLQTFQTFKNNIEFVNLFFFPKGILSFLKLFFTRKPPLSHLFFTGFKQFLRGSSSTARPGGKHITVTTTWASKQYRAPGYDANGGRFAGKIWIIGWIPWKKKKKTPPKFFFLKFFFGLEGI